ncbi:hypothetical protein Pst134EB_023394 [Puccinia striiformis f. sp. tritici]|nr:hypothetical protein Pst134EB_023394 [Puccinia striiformis f. sp. tritici]
MNNVHHHPPQLLVDLILTEKTYANDLFIIINQVAAAFSPTNLPPAHLDNHFRLIESIFRFHKAFHAHSILPIDQAQSNTHLLAFVSLFNTLVTQLAPVYHRYCHPTGWAGAGGWTRDPHLNNSNHTLIQILLSLNWPDSLPKPNCPPIFPEAPYPPEDLFIYDSNSVPHPTLTVFFALPFARLFYYRKLSQLLLQSLQHGTAEHKSVYDSAQQITILLNRGRAQWSLSPLQLMSAVQLPTKPPPPQPIAASFGQESSPRRLSPVPPAHPSSLRTSTETTLSGLAESSIGSTIDEVFDQTNPSTPLSSSSLTFEAQQQATHKLPPRDMVQVSRGVFVQQAVLNLQTQLDTSRCLDIFTMSPKQCRLLLAPPTLAYSRLLRFSSDANFKICPHSDPTREIKTTSGRLILITDLLMFCEHKDLQLSPKPPTMWLMYPPLAGKHLQVNPVCNDLEFAFDVVAMGKEVVRVSVSNLTERDVWVQHLQDAIKFGQQVAHQKQIGPAVPENPSQALLDGTCSSLKTPKLLALSSLSISNAIPPRLGTQSQPISPSFSNSSDIRPASSFSAHPDHQPAHQSFPSLAHQFHKSPSDTGGALVSQMAAHSLGPPQNSFQHPSRNRDPQQERGDFSPQRMNVNGSQAQSLRSPGMYSDGHPSQPGPGPSNPAGFCPDQTVPLRTIRKAPSAHALGARFDPRTANLPPMPIPFGQPSQASNDPRSSGKMPIALTDPNLIVRSTSTEPYRDRQYRPPSSIINRGFERPPSGAIPNSRSSKLTTTTIGTRISGFKSEDYSDDDDDLPPQSPVQTTPKDEKSILAASMKTKVFLKQSHSQWKSLGTAKLHLFISKPGNHKQLVVGSEKGNKTLISTIVLSDGVERVGRTGVAVDLSDRGARTGIVYMLQMKNENSAVGLFEQLLEGSDRRPQ